MITKSINDLYHEATHAYIDLKLEEEVKFKLCERKHILPVCQEPLFTYERS